MPYFVAFLVRTQDSRTYGCPEKVPSRQEKYQSSPLGSSTSGAKAETYIAQKETAKDSRECHRRAN